MSESERERERVAFSISNLRNCHKLFVCFIISVEGMEEEVCGRRKAAAAEILTIETLIGLSRFAHQSALLYLFSQNSEM